MQTLHLEFFDGTLLFLFRRTDQKKKLNTTLQLLYEQNRPKQSGISPASVACLGPEAVHITYTVITRTIWERSKSSYLEFMQ